jgi:hypothetical protein
MHIAPEPRKISIMKLKAKLNLLTIVLLLATTITFSQKKDDAQYIISGDVGINKYHDQEELESMRKGELLSLYNVRIEIIIKILPNIAFATKPGVTMSSLGIPDTKDNRRALKENIEATITYFDNTIEFQKIVLPYSDRTSLISAILFYEETLKALHTYNDFK